MEKKLLTITEAAQLLGVSRPTFNKIRQERGLTEVPVGKRVRFQKSEIMAIINVETSVQKVPLPRLPETSFDVFSEASLRKIEIKKNIFDLRNIKLMDPYGVLSLLTTIIGRGKSGERVELLIDTSIACKYLQSINFFGEIQRACTNITWDKNILVQSNYFDPETILPITPLRMKGTERRVAEKLIELLKTQGFSDSVGSYIAWILGELADNSLTHSSQNPSDRICYVLASRFLISESNCIIVGIADLGLGIHKSLKSVVKYSTILDERAVLEAFKTNVSSWDEHYNRGKGLTDVLKIAKGNSSYFRVASGKYAFLIDFRDKENPSIIQKKPMTEVSGTRFGLVIIDNHFKEISRKEVNDFIENEIRRLGI